MLLHNVELRVYVPNGTTDEASELLMVQGARQIQLFANRLPELVPGIKVYITEV